MGPTCPIGPAQATALEMKDRRGLPGKRNFVFACSNNSKHDALTRNNTGTVPQLINIQFSRAPIVPQISHSKECFFPPEIVTILITKNCVV